MARQFTDAEWQRINSQLQADPERYGMPERRDGSVVFGSWNLREFGAVANRSAGAHAFIAAFAGRCDLLAVQEVQRNMESLEHLVAAMNGSAPGGRAYRTISSDVTGEAPAARGNPERFTFIYDTERVELGNVVSDITFDRSEVLKSFNAILTRYHDEIVAADPDAGMLDKLKRMFARFTGLEAGRLPEFFQFIRSPYVATFTVLGEQGHSYDIACVNAHTVSGKSKAEREREFLALLQWLVISNSDPAKLYAPLTMLMADLNLDFSTANDKRREAIATTVTGLNADRTDGCKVNFPFLDAHSEKGTFFTNSRADETFDHIALFSLDDRFPRARFNSEAASGNTDGFDYGMLDFVRLFVDAGVGALDTAERRKALYERFEFDLSDHMPIWLRMPVPKPGQRRYVTGD